MGRAFPAPGFAAALAGWLSISTAERDDRIKVNASGLPSADSDVECASFNSAEELFNQSQSSTLSVLQGVLGAVILIGLAACSTAGPPTTPAVASSANLSLAQLLRDAEHSDRLNAQLYTRSAPSLDHYYNLKADEVDDVMRRLQRGENVPSDDINHALDNSLASTFGVPVN